MILQSYLNKSEAKQFGLYALIGVLTYAVDYLTFSLFVSAGMMYAVADTVNIPIVLGFNYVAHSTITFRSKDSKKNTIPKYILNSIFLYIYSIAVLVFFVELLGSTPFIAKVIQLGTIPMFNYVILRNFVFGKK